MDSAESQSSGGAAGDQELPAQGAHPNRAPGVTPESCKFIFASLAFSFAMIGVCLLLGGTGILLGLLSSQLLPFLHPLARLAYGLLAVWLIISLFFFTWASVFVPHGTLASSLREIKRAHPERFEHAGLKRAINTCTSLLLIAYLIMFVLAPTLLIAHWPVWSLPPTATGLVNTVIFLGITALFILLTRVPRWILSRLDRKPSDNRTKPAL